MSTKRQSQKNLPYKLHRTPNIAKNTQHKLGVAFSYLERKKPFERTANNTLPQKLENHCITYFSYWIILLATVLLQTLYLGIRLMLQGLNIPSFLVVSNIRPYALTVERFQHASHFCKILQNPSAKTFKSLFLTQVFHRIRKT